MDILFWSGGKDAYLAYEFYRQNNPERDLALLTTYSEEAGIVPHQKIPVENIRQQARALNLNLNLVPLPKECPNDIYLHNVNQALQKQADTVEHLIFGDWYLQDIRDWRKQQFEAAGYQCLFPIWQIPLDQLLPMLLLKPVEIKISAVKEKYRKYIKVGELFNQQFIRQLPESIDPMGEKGEFHTEVVFQTWD